MDAASALPGEHVQNVSLYWMGLERDSVNRRYWISDNGFRWRRYHRSRAGLRGRKDNSWHLRDGTHEHYLPDIGRVNDARRSNTTPKFIAIDHLCAPIPEQPLLQEKNAPTVMWITCQVIAQASEP